MASSRFLISSQTLSSSAATVTFSSIPATYTDIVLKASARTDTNNGTFFDNIFVAFNSDTATNYSSTFLAGAGAGGASSGRLSTQTILRLSYAADGTDATASTFGNAELYVPSYGASQNKPISAFNVSESNNTTVYMSAVAGLWRNTAAINRIDLTCGGNFVSGSSFYLYGLKNS